MHLSIEASMAAGRSMAEPFALPQPSAGDRLLRWASLAFGWAALVGGCAITASWIL